MIELGSIKIGDEFYHGNINLAKDKLSFTDYRDLKLFRVIGIEKTWEYTKVTIEEVRHGQEAKKPETRVIRFYTYKICSATILEADGEVAKERWNQVLESLEESLDLKIKSILGTAKNIRTRLEKLKK